MDALSAAELVLMIDDEPFRLVENASFSVQKETSTNSFLGIPVSRTVKNGPQRIQISFDTLCLIEDVFLQKFLNFTALKIGFFSIGDTLSFSLEQCYISSLNYSFNVGQPGKLSVSLITCGDLENETVENIDSALLELKKTNIASFDIDVGITDAIIKSFNLSFTREIGILYSCFDSNNKTLFSGPINVSAQANMEASQHVWENKQESLQNEKSTISAIITSLDNIEIFNYSNSQMILTEASISTSAAELVNLNLSWQGRHDA